MRPSLPAQPPAESGAPVPAEVLALTPLHCFATWHRTFLLIWRREAQAEAVAELHRQLSRFVAAAPAPPCLLVIIEKHVAIPNEAARRAFASLSRDLIPRLARAVAVPEGGALRLSLVRGITTALTFILPHKVPYHFCESVPAAISELAPYLGDAPAGPAGLHRAVAELRRRLA